MSDSAQPDVRAVVLAGVSGSGKTTVGKALARDLDWTFLDADNFHSSANVEKMRAGEPLTDEDREPWLQALAVAVRERLARSEGVVLACSALKQSYRERLRVDESVRFAFLEADAELLRQRLEERTSHYFPAGLLASQLQTLEPPTDALTLDAALPPDALVREVERAFGLPRG